MYTKARPSWLEILPVVQPYEVFDGSEIVSLGELWFLYVSDILVRMDVLDVEKMGGKRNTARNVEFEKCKRCVLNTLRFTNGARNYSKMVKLTEKAL